MGEKDQVLFYFHALHVDKGLVGGVDLQDYVVDEAATQIRAVHLQLASYKVIL